MILKLIFVFLICFSDCIFAQDKPALPIDFKDITLQNGTVFEGGTITGYDLDIVTIMSSSGIGRHKWSAVPKDLQKVVGVDIDGQRKARDDARQQEINAVKKASEERRQSFLSNPPKPESDGSYKFINDLLRGILINPDSLKIYAVSKPYLVEDHPSDKDRPGGWCVKCDWGAQIKSGGMERHTDEFIIPESGEIYSFSLSWWLATRNR